mmetsp:Transcript_17155/g.54854  ORF Transcript_17155/g.54854 Transcript_17155/m.54854 type:complete len:373 (+) Transcript_17155:656-1774(+)
MRALKLSWSRGTSSSRLARSRWSMVRLSFWSLRSISCLSLICSVRASSMSWRLSSFSPSLSCTLLPFLPFFACCSSSSARASSSSFSSMSCRMRASSRLRDSSSRRLASASSCFFCAISLRASSSRSCSSSSRSCSSLRRSMTTLRASTLECSFSTVPMTPRRRSFFLASSSAWEGGSIMPMALLRRLESTVICPLSLSLSSSCAPKCTMPLAWSMRIWRKLYLTASTICFSTSAKDIKGTILVRCSILMVVYTCDTCWRRRTVASLSRAGTYSSRRISATGEEPESAPPSPLSFWSTGATRWQRSSGWSSSSSSCWSSFTSGGTMAVTPFISISERSAERESTSRVSRLGSRVKPRRLAMRRLRSRSVSSS